MSDDKSDDANRDPITGGPGAHRLGTGLGALLGGAAAGAATGTVAGPIGAVVGAAMGALVGGLAGKRLAEWIDSTVASGYWCDDHRGRVYAAPGASFDDYGPAYGYGLQARARYPGRDFDAVEVEMSGGWAAVRGMSTLDWGRARHAVRAAWHRVGGASGGRS